MYYRFLADDFAVRLPWFYFSHDFEQARPGKIWNFEVNGLTNLPAGSYDLLCLAADGVETLELSLDDENFETMPVASGRVMLKDRRIDNFMISLYWRDAGVETAPPAREVWLAPAGEIFPADFSDCPPWQAYKRDSLLQERPAARDWNGFYSRLRQPAAGKPELESMVREIADWAARRQVRAPSDVHYGAIYSEEDKYDFQDAAAAAVLFMRMSRWTGDDEWRARARLAVNYVYKGQHQDSAIPIRYGGIPSMCSFETNDYRRLALPLAAPQGVATSVIANLLVKVFEEGLNPERADLDALERIQAFVLANEYAPGRFTHHEGDARGINGSGDCQNSNALGAGALLRLTEFLKPFGRGAAECSIAAARRGIERTLTGQEAIGVWPYCFAVIGRGQKYQDSSLPDHGMGLYHFLTAVNDPPWRHDKRVRRVLRRAALWYLCMGEFDPQNGDINLAYVREPKGVAFSSFAWCRFMCAASLFRIGAMLGEPEPFRSFALHLMQTIHTHYWNHTDPARAPVQASMHRNLKPVTWIQAAEWDGVLLLEMIDALDAE